MATRGPSEKMACGMSARTCSDYQNRGLFHAIGKHMVQHIQRVYPKAKAICSVRSGVVSLQLINLIRFKNILKCICIVQFIIKNVELKQVYRNTNNSRFNLLENMDFVGN